MIKRNLIFLILFLCLPSVVFAGMNRETLRTSILQLEEHLQRAQAAQGPLCDPEVLARAQTCLTGAKEEYLEGDYWESEDMLEACQSESEGIWDRILACGKDQDVDGVPDLNDLCPEAPETYNGYRDRDGCPDRMPERALLAVEKIELIEPLHFEEETQQILPISQRVLKSVAGILQENPGLKLEIQAHLDDSVPPDRAVEMTLLRAENVKDALVALGISPARLIAVGKGSREPVASNDSPLGRLVNQRVEFVRVP